MPHALEWSCAYAHRLQGVPPLAASASDAIGRRLASEISQGTLPFLTMPYRQRLEADLPPVIAHAKKFRHMLLLGIGGSALGARALQKAFAPGMDGPGHSGPCLWIADNVCPETFTDWLAALDPKDTVVTCISKSGGTIETLSQYFLVREWLSAALGDAWRDHMIVVTDAKAGYLREQATQLGLQSLEVPDHLGGRYSALSAVGLLPAGFLGIDWQGLLKGAARVAEPIAKDPTKVADHPSLAIAAWAKALEDKDYSQLIFFCYIPRWTAFGLWFAQLWAESLGKEGKGTMPVPATGVTDQHSVNQMFLDGPRNKGCIFLTQAKVPDGPTFSQDLPDVWSWLRGKPFGSLLEAEAMGTRMALVQQAVPLLHVEMGATDAEAAGSMMMLLEAATIFTGWLMDINPVDQPAVELGKRLANARLGASGYPKESADLAAYLSATKRRQDF
ncbi:MAG: glucose-6-phosphate isomerase [Desulfovibrio sp.]|jgi:glucose-6-phosphate isomerase|nr:glucose-6-phosphate isomerase [Desulfovibrio sp.]